MYFQGKALLITLLIAIAVGKVSGDRNCSNECQLQFRCDPYFNSLVWSIVKGVCKVIKNPCIFASENCSRENQCLKPLKQISQEQCQRKCPICQGKKDSKYCVTFMYTDELGERIDAYMEFANQCLAEQYACDNAIAYVNGNNC